MNITVQTAFKWLFGLATVFSLAACDVFESSGRAPSGGYYQPSTFNPTPQTVPGYTVLPPSQLNDYSPGFY